MYVVINNYSIDNVIHCLFIISTLAGSTIMLLTLAWGGSVFLGRCDLDSNGEAIDETGSGVNCRQQVQ